MKKLILLLPLFSGLLLVGCTRTESQKTSASNDRSDHPTLPDLPAKETTPAPTQVATTPGAMAPAATDSVALASQPAIDPSTSVVTAETTPSSPSTNPPAIPTPSEPLIFNSTMKAPADRAGAGAKSDLDARVAEWNLRPEDIKAELETSGRVMRLRTQGANEPTGPMDANLVSQINEKIRHERDTSGLQIDVQADKGVVTLSGSAHSLDQIGRALALALDNPGVTQAISTIKLDGTP